MQHLKKYGSSSMPELVKVSKHTFEMSTHDVTLWSLRSGCIPGLRHRFDLAAFLELAVLARGLGLLAWP
jgi:hypothetical protein